MEIKPNTKAYHCNDTERCKQFVSDSNYLIISEDKNSKWIGTGMYFWDNKSNAHYWKGQKESKNSDIEHSIVTANIYTDKILDLTDKETVDCFQKLWEMCSTKMSRQTSKLGRKIDIIFDELAPIIEWKVVKIHAQYSINECVLFANENLPHPTQTVRTIYSIKEANQAVNRNFLQEVIE